MLLFFVAVWLFCFSTCICVLSFLHYAIPRDCFRQNTDSMCTLTHPFVGSRFLIGDGCTDKGHSRVGLFDCCGVLSKVNNRRTWRPCSDLGFSSQTPAVRGFASIYEDLASTDEDLASTDEDLAPRDEDRASINEVLPPQMKIGRRGRTGSAGCSSSQPLCYTIDTLHANTASQKCGSM